MSACCEKQEAVLRVNLASTYYQRLKGLIGADPITQNQGLLIERTRWIHTWFMGFSIDCVGIDNEDTIITIARGIPPFQIKVLPISVTKIIELPAGKAAELKLDVGITIRLRKISSTFGAIG